MKIEFIEFLCSKIKKINKEYLYENLSDDIKKKYSKYYSKYQYLSIDEMEEMLTKNEIKINYSKNHPNYKNYLCYKVHGLLHRTK